MKVRNLQQSHAYREYKKSDPTGAFYVRRRIFRPAPGPPKEREITIPEKKIEKPVSQTKDALDEEIQRTRSEREVIRKWVEERKSQREDLHALGLTSSWMENKSEKTECEKRVMQRMSEPSDAIKDEVAAREKQIIKRNRRLSSAHVDLLPFVRSPLPIALAMIADYLVEKRIRLIDLFTKIDRNKDWRMTRDELKTAFKNIEIPLSEEQLDHLIFTLDINNDNELSYKEVAQGIEAYHKDKRWQSMKFMYDNMIAETESESHESDVITTKSELNLLNLPAVAKPKRQRGSPKKLSARQRAALWNKQVSEQKAVGSFYTTMAGSLMQKRIETLVSLDRECKYCIEKLHENGIFIQRDNLVRVFIPPQEDAESACIARLSSSRSMFPFTHAMNIDYRKNQRRILRRLARPNSTNSRNDKNWMDTSGQDHQKKKKNTRFLPRVANFDEISKEGQKKRRQIERASPSPYWPQHLMDKLCLCMDTCHIGRDRKEVMFNLVK